MRRLPLRSCWLLACAAALVAALAWAPPAPAHAGSRGMPSRLSRSIGWPDAGLLVGGAKVAESDRVHHPADDRTRGWFWGTAELVSLVEHTAMTLAQDDPDAPRLMVGELSRRGGGNVPGHRSHENGRDVDIGFFLTDTDGRPVETDAFVNVRGSGRGFDHDREVRFDDARNWRLVAVLLGQTEVPVQYIFTNRVVRRRVLRAARRLGADPALVARAERAILPPLGSHHPHRNHFHVRVYCDPGDVPGCRDRGVVWRWVPEAFLADPRTVRAKM